jgi:hypothetical protein
MHRAYARRVLLYHPRVVGRDGVSRLAFQYRPGPPAPDPRDARRLVCRIRGWPEWRIDLELGRVARGEWNGDRPADPPADA